MFKSHPLFGAAKQLLSDLLSTIAFLVLVEVTGRLAFAVGVAIGVGLAQVAYLRLKREKIDRMQWLSLALVVVFGGASLLTGNFLFFRLKFSLIYAAIGAVMLTPGWMNRYTPPLAQARAGDVTARFGYAWSALFFATAALNLALALLAKPSIWAVFIGVFPLASKCALILAQYVTTRAIIRRRIRAEPALNAA